MPCHHRQLLLGCVGARALVVGSRGLRLGCGPRLAGLLLRHGCALVGVAGVLQAPLVESAARAELLGRSAKQRHLLEQPRLAGAAHSVERDFELRRARGNLLVGGCRLVAPLLHTLLVDAQLGHTRADALGGGLLRQVGLRLELGRVLDRCRIELLQEGFEPSAFRGWRRSPRLSDCRTEGWGFESLMPHLGSELAVACPQRGHDRAIDLAELLHMLLGPLPTGQLAPFPLLDHAQHRVELHLLSAERSISHMYVDVLHPVVPPQPVHLSRHRLGHLVGVAHDGEVGDIPQEFDVATAEETEGGVGSSQAGCHTAAAS